MRTLLAGTGLLLALGLYPLAADAGKESPHPVIGKIVRLDPGLDKLIPPDARIEIVAKGHVWTEGPCWVPSGGYLLYSDIPRNSVYKLQDGKVSLFLKPSGYTGKEKRENEDGSDEPGSNGVELTPDGKHIVLCQHGDRQVVKMALDTPGKFQVLARDYQGKRLNSPNDAVYDARGNLYFTDPPYGLKQREKDPAKELDFHGVYRVSPDGELTLLTKEMSRPNGIALSPDGKKLYVANSDPSQPIWKVFPVKKDGTLGKGKILYNAMKELAQYKKGLPDGLCVDADGNLFATGPGGCYVFNAKGTLLGILYTGERTSNCTFGGDDGRTLFLTTDDYITQVRTSTRGKGL